MKAKLIINNQELEVEISEEEYKKLQPKEEKKTGYERVDEDSEYYYINFRGDVEGASDTRSSWDDDPYDRANYYSSETVAQNNARADQLMRQLRRFAVEHRENEINWHTYEPKCFIKYDYGDARLHTAFNENVRYPGVVYFNSIEIAQLAIDTFHDELIWYFAEYKDSL